MGQGEVLDKVGWSIGQEAIDKSVLVEDCVMEPEVVGFIIDS